MKKLLAILLISMSLFACTKDVKTETILKVTMTYELDVAEQDNISHYTIQVSNDGQNWQDAGMILAEENSGSMEHKYAIPIDVSRWYKKGERFYQRTISYDKGGPTAKYQISKVTSQFFE